MILNLKKNTLESLIPCDEDSVKAFNKLKVGDDIYVEYKPRRNYKFHKKLFSMLNLILNNQSYYKGVEGILEACKYRAGYFETFVDHEGNKLLKTKSIAFHSMDNQEFEKFYSSSIDTCLELVPMGRNELENAVLRYC